MFEGINWLAVVVSTIAFFFLGAVWYSALFGKTWAKLVDIDWENPGGNTGLIFGMTFVFEFIASLVMALLLHITGFEGWQGGLHLALMLGFGVVLPVIAINNMYQRRSFALTAIDAGHMSLGLIIVGVILGLWS